ncbi:MAG: ABC transporter ATP-binding protein [Clostridia bacterium]|nr:ABC transporter ATP-binding protein [Clostridia bacterium]MDD4375997.1 ABC transporter ATP-binding protein [Clostridia bacterium]
MKKLLKYLKQFKWMIIGITIFVVIQTVGDLYLPKLMSDVINNGISKVEYKLDEAKLKEALINGEIPELTAIIEDSGITKEMLGQNPEATVNSLKENMLNVKESKDLKDISSEEQAFLKQMMNSGVIIAKNVTDMDYIIKVGIKMIIVTLIITVVTVLATFLSAKTSTGYGTVIRNKLFAKVSSFSQGDLNKFGAPSLITRTTNDVTQVQNATFMVLRMMIMVPIMCVGSIFMALSKDKGLSWILAVVIPILFIILGIIMRKAIPLFKFLQKKLDRINLIMREQLTGVKVIRAFDKESYEKKRFATANEEHITISIKVHRILAVLMPVMTILINFTIIAIVWFGSKRIELGALQIGDLMAFVQYAIQVLFSFVMATMMFVMLPRAVVSGNRIQEVLDTEPSIKNKEELKEVQEEKGTIEFKNVDFYYPDSEEQEKALSNISFNAMPGKVTAIIGSTGSSKTTILKLISRYYDVTSGEILIDGVNIKDYDIKKLRKMIGYVPQKAFLFSGTIKDNILYGKKDAKNEEIMRALNIAQANEFIETLEDGILSQVSQGGNNFSGGQKQRLSIARAIVRKPKIYLFDDSFSALDFKTDKNLRKALESEIKNSTIIIVAQRISTIMDADQIIVLDEGKIAGIGKHKELLESSEVYKEIVYSQLTEEEVG